MRSIRLEVVLDDTGSRIGSTGAPESDFDFRRFAHVRRLSSDILFLLSRLLSLGIPPSSILPVRSEAETETAFVFPATPTEDSFPDVTVS